MRDVDQDEVPALMLEHARELLRAVGYGSGEGPFVEMGIGIDVGEAFVGNIGERALYDFTAVGDVVNTASRLQGQAAGGEIVLSERVAAGLPEPAGTRDGAHPQGKERAPGRLPRDDLRPSSLRTPVPKLLRKRLPVPRLLRGEALLVEVAAQLVQLGRLDPVDVVGLGEVA